MASGVAGLNLTGRWPALLLKDIVMSKTAKIPLPTPSAVGFRAAIDAAVAEGFSREAMVLRLTLRDSAALRRNPAVPIEDISYSGGIMRFLGVSVVEGNIVNSLLDRAPELTPEVVAPPVKPKKKAPVKPRK